MNKHRVIFQCHNCKMDIKTSPSTKHKDEDGNRICVFCATDLESVAADSKE